MRNRKLLDQALRNPSGLRFEEAKKLAQAFGFRLDRSAAAITFLFGQECRGW